MHRAIINWLGNPAANYQDGVELYCTYGKSNFLKELFKSETVFNRQKLAIELEKLIDTPEQIKKATESIPAKLKERPAVITQARAENRSYPESLVKKQAEKGSLYKKVARLHSELERYSSDEERLNAANEIIKGFKVINAIWEELDYFDLHGVLKPDNGVNVDSMSLIDLIKRKHTLRTYISRGKRVTPPDPRIPEFENEIKRIDQLIEENDNE